MKTVIIVGAGASVAEAMPQQPARKNTPPLDGTFFELCRLRRPDGLSTLVDYMKKNYGVDLLNPGHTMEEVFNIVYSDALSETSPGPAVDAYWALLQMYRAMIRATTNALLGTSRKGVGALLRQVQSYDPPSRLTFITFNQDLLIEKAIHEALGTTTYGTIPFHLETAYRVGFTGVLTKHGGRRAQFRTNGAPSDSVAVLKLHGSMNWAYTVRSATDAKNSLRAPGGDLYCLNDTEISLKARETSGTKARHLLPLIVPPVYEKSMHIRNVLAPVWTSARAALREADEIIVFGYSFPNADVSARNTLRQAFHHNDHVERVHVIDIDPWVGGKLGRLLACGAYSFYRDVEEFRRHYRR